MLNGNARAGLGPCGAAGQGRAGRGSWPGEAHGAGDAAAATGGACDGHQGTEVFVRQRQGAEQAGDGFGQKGIGEQPGGCGERGAEAEAADQDEEGHAAEARGEAGGAADGVLQQAEGVGGGCIRQSAEEAVPEAGMGEAAEEAGDGVGAAVVRREGSPRGAGGGGVVEDGLHPRAEGGGAAALGGERGEVRGQGGPGGVGEGGGMGWGAHSVSDRRKGRYRKYFLATRCFFTFCPLSTKSSNQISTHQEFK